MNLHTLSRQEAADRLGAILEADQIVLGTTAIDSLTFVLPGVASKLDLQDAKTVLEIAGHAGPPAPAVVDDTVAALLANLCTIEGVCAIAGSGASVFCGHTSLLDIPSPARYPFKFDGWGPLLGDFGGGFTIGMGLLREICRSIDRDCDCPDVFFSLLEKEQANGLEDPAKIQGWFDSLIRTDPESWKLRISDLAAVVTGHLREKPDDQICRRLVDYGAEELAHTIAIALEHNNIVKSQVICQGGMFRHCSQFYHALQEHVSGRGFELTFTLAEWHPVLGGLLIALHKGPWHNREEITRLREETLARLEAQTKGSIHYDYPWHET